jgi:hypothetical protein
MSLFPDNPRNTKSNRESLVGEAVGVEIQIMEPHHRGHLYDVATEFAGGEAATRKLDCGLEVACRD